jgi:hypothetical protein
MKVLKRIGIGLLSIVIILLVAGLFMPKDYVVTREVTIAKPKTEVFAYVKQLKNQNNYSAWAMMEPDMKKTFRGVDGTPGFVSAWEGEDVGKGEQEILKIREGEGMDTELRFEKPFKAKANAHINTEAVDESQTKVSWTFEGAQSYPLNVMNPVMKWQLGKSFQEGLDNLKKNLETAQPISQVVQ